MVQSRLTHCDVHEHNPVRKRLESLQTLLFPAIEFQGMEGDSRYIPSRDIGDRVFTHRNLEMVEQML